MKKMQKMLSVALIGFLLCPLLPIHAAAATPTAVYTKFTSGNDSHTGSGTASSPYNLFEDALAAVADGGIIYLSGNAFVNSADNAPLKIEKNVTIKQASGLSDRPTLEMRKCGIVLGGNVTFDNVVLAFSSAYRPVICANGYTLTLNDVSYSSGTRVIHLAGGSLYRQIDNQIQLDSPTPGSQSKIVLSGASTKLGNIYAGSINGSFDGTVDIELNGISGSSVEAIYASGAQEGYYNGENFLDPKNEPEYPTAYAYNFPVTGKVSINLTNSTVRTLDGETCGDTNASLTVSSQYEYSPQISNFAALTVASGNGPFSPKAAADGEFILMETAVTVQSGGRLNLSGLGDLCYVGSFNGQGGELQLGSAGSVSILKGCTGTATLSIYGYASATYDHQYIYATTSEDVFQFTPNSAQSDIMQLVHVGEGWRTTKKDGSLGADADTTPTLTSFSLPQTQMQVKDSTLNTTGIEIPVDAAFTEESWADDLGAIPLVYTVTYNNNTCVQNQTSDDSAYAGYYTLTISDLNLLIEPGGQVIQIFPADFKKTIPAGTYTFEITAPLKGGQSVTQTLTLTVVDDSPEKTLWSVDGVYSGGVTVTFRNLTGQTISDGILLAGAYDHGRLQAAQIWADPISNLDINGTQQARFSFTGVQYNEIRLFLCDKQTLLPLCQEYSSAD